MKLTACWSLGSSITAKKAAVAVAGGARVGNAPSSAEPTFRQLVERFAEDSGVELLPKAGRRQDGLQVGLPFSDRYQTADRVSGCQGMGCGALSVQSSQDWLQLQCYLVFLYKAESEQHGMQCIQGKAGSFCPEKTLT